LLGPVQLEALKRLKDAEAGLQVEELLKHWRYKQCGEKSIAGLRHRGLIMIAKDRVYFVRLPEALEARLKTKTYTPEQWEELEDLSRRNLVYLYKDELEKYRDVVVPGRALPGGVKRSLQHLGVLKWRILELTDLGRRLLGETMSKASPQLQRTNIGP